MPQVIPDFTMSQRYANYTVKRLLRHLQRICHYAGTDPRDLDDAKVRLAALAIVADAMVAEVIERRNDSLIHAVRRRRSRTTSGRSRTRSSPRH